MRIPPGVIHGTDNFSPAGVSVCPVYSPGAGTHFAPMEMELR